MKIIKRGLKIIGLIGLTMLSVKQVKADSITYTIQNNENFYNSKQQELEIAYNYIENNNYDYYIIHASNDILLEVWDTQEMGYSKIIGNNEDYLIYNLIVNHKQIAIYGSDDIRESNITEAPISLMSQDGLQIYDTNYNNFIYDGLNYDIIYKGFYSDDIIIRQNSNIPTLKNLYQYSTWSEYEQNYIQGYEEVNLNNYEYVILSLKNYKQSDAFQTNMYVKGQIGITPVYNYGQTTKDAITGVKVQDRCNISYESYTEYPFYIIQTDLQNNVVYYVKQCEENSSFKYDTEVFNITYITQENKNNPTITIDGNTYNVIKYEDLPSTATKNEEENYIPGESGNAMDTSGIDGAIKNVQQNMSQIWNTITYFTDFVGLIFSALPVEIRTILLSALVVAITIGLIKIFIN